MPTESGRLHGKRLLILDGSKKAIEVIEQARDLGVQTFVTDYNDPKDSPAKLAADGHFDISIADIDDVVNLIHRERIDGVLPGFSDRWLPRYAEICDRAGLPSYATADQLRLFTDKKQYKQLLERHGVPTVRGFSREEAESDDIPADSYPLLVKPADGSGSRGIARCDTPEQLRDALAVALDYSWTGEVVIERYLPGEEATAYWVFQDGEYFVTMVANRHMFSFGDGEFRLPVAYTSPSHLVPRYLADVAPRVRAALQEAGVRDGMMFLQGLIKNGVFHTYDIGFRVTPTQEYRILERLCGYNPLKMLIEFAVTGSMGQTDLAAKARPDYDGYGFNVSTLVMPGVIARFEGVDAVASDDGILSVATSVSPGDTLPPEALGQLRQVVIRTIGTADSRSELEASIDRITQVLRVYDPEGEEMSMVGSLAPEVAGKLLRGAAS